MVPDPRSPSTARGPIRSAIHSIRLSALCLAVLALAHVALMTLLPIYPFVDLPLHLAAAAILRDSRDPSGILRYYYELDLSLKPNLAHLYFCALPLFPDVETANRIYFSLYVLAVPSLTWLLIRRLGGNTWLAMLSFLLLYNFNVAWGFVGYALSIPALLVFLLLLTRRRPPDSPGGLAALAAVLASFFFIHVLMALFAVALYAVWATLAPPRAPRRVVLRSLAAAPLVALTIIWWLRQPMDFQGESTAGRVAEYYTGEFFPEFWQRIVLFWLDNMYLFYGLGGLAAGATASALILSVLACGLWRGRRRLPGLMRARRITPIVLLLLCALGLYLISPPRMPGHAYIFHRFSVFFWLGVILVAGLFRLGRWTAPFAVASCLAATVHFALWADHFFAFEREARSFRQEVMPAVPPGYRVGYVLFEERFRRARAYAHFPDYQIVWNHGPATTFLTETRFGPIRRRKDAVHLPPYIEIPPYLRRYAIEILEGAECVLVRGDITWDAQVYFQNFHPLRSDGAWTLYLRNDLGSLPPPQALGLPSPAASRASSD